MSNLNITSNYWQRLLFAALGAIAALSISTWLRIPDHDPLLYIGILVLVPVLPIGPFLDLLYHSAADLFHTFQAGIEARSDKSDEVLPPEAEPIILAADTPSRRGTKDGKKSAKKVNAVDGGDDEELASGSSLAVG